MNTTWWQQMRGQRPGAVFVNRENRKSNLTPLNSDWSYLHLYILNRQTTVRWIKQGPEREKKSLQGACYWVNNFKNKLENVKIVIRFTWISLTRLNARIISSIGRRLPKFLELQRLYHGYKRSSSRHLKPAQMGLKRSSQSPLNHATDRNYE